MTVTTMSRTRPAPGPAPRRHHRVAPCSRGIVELLGRRPDLVGVYRPADVAAESVCWSV